MRRLLLAAALPLAGCGSHAATAPGVPGSGTGPARSFAVANFSTVESTGSDDVQIATGTGFSVRAEGDPGVLDKLRVVRNGATLEIGRSPGFTFGVGRKTKVFVTMPRIARATVAGSGDIAIDHVDADRFDGAVDGSGDLSVRALKVGAVAVAIQGSGDIALAGAARSFAAMLTGSGNIDARHLKAGEANVTLPGSGNVQADVTGNAKVDLSGSGDVDLGGAARCSISKTGSGSVRCGR